MAEEFLHYASVDFITDGAVERALNAYVVIVYQHCILNGVYKDIRIASEHLNGAFDVAV